MHKYIFRIHFRIRLLIIRLIDIPLLVLILLIHNIIRRSILCLLITMFRLLLLIPLVRELGFDCRSCQAVLDTQHRLG